MDVQFRYQNGRLEIYPSDQGLRLEHAQGCPCRFLTSTDIANIASETKSQGVVVGVAVILQSSDRHVLLTRRAKHMRTFPGVWVPPGGHLEPGEKLQEACMRELREETGLQFSQDNLTVTRLGLWESVYPPVIAMGLPKRHHIVVYLLAQAREDHHTLETKVKLQEHELDAATWLDQYVATEVASSDDYGQTNKMPMRYFKASVIQDGTVTTKNLPLSILMATLPPSGPPVESERLSSGTKFALRQWLKFLYPPTEGNLQRGDSLETVFQMITKCGHQPLK